MGTDRVRRDHSTSSKYLFLKSARLAGLKSATSAIGLSAMAVLAVAPADAQGEEASAPDDSVRREATIVVTATKTGAQALEDVPFAIQAFSGESLTNRNIREGADLIELIPGASQVQQIGAGYRIFAFRGTGAGGPVGDGMVGYYLDDTPFGVPNNQTAPPLQYFDIERVEVLRGPQGTLYGQGSMGGAIIYRTKNPDMREFTTEGEAAVSSTADASDPNYRVSAAVSVPLIKDKLGLRLSGGYDYQAGYVDVYSDGPVGKPRLTDANDITAKNLQAVLLWQPTDDLSVRLRAWEFSTDQDFLSVFASVDPPYAANQGDVNGYDKRKARFYSNTINYDFGNFTLTNATSYQESLPGGFSTGLGLGPPLGTGVLKNGGDSDSFVNEFRLATNTDGPFHWVGGLYYQKAEGLYTFNLDFPSLSLDGTTLTKTENSSVFSEISYDLFDGKLVPLVGLRYYQDTRSSESVSNGVPANSKADLDATTWRVNLAYYPTEDWTVFFNAGTGFRSGILQSQAQADAVIADGVPTDISLRPDELRNIEVGVKGSLLNGALNVAASVYDVKFTDLQAAFNTSIGLAAFANQGDGKTQGLDVEVRWETPVEGLSLAAIANVNKSEFTNIVPEFAAADPRAGNGQTLFNTPPHNARVDLDYFRPLSGKWELNANASATFNNTGKNQDASVELIGNYELFDASVGFRRDNYEIRLFGDNLSDERGPTTANGVTLLAGPRPRTIGVQLRLLTK